MSKKEEPSTTEWTQWGMEQMLFIARRVRESQDGAMKTLVSKSFQLLGINGILVGLFVNGVVSSVRVEIGALQRRFLLLVLVFFIVASASTALFSVLVLFPKKVYLTDPNDKLRDQIREEPDRVISHHIWNILTKETNLQKEELKTMSAYQKKAWISFALQIITAGIYAILFFFAVL